MAIFIFISSSSSASWLHYLDNRFAINWCSLPFQIISRWPAGLSLSLIVANPRFSRACAAAFAGVPGGVVSVSNDAKDVNDGLDVIVRKPPGGAAPNGVVVDVGLVIDAIEAPVPVVTNAGGRDDDVAAPLVTDAARFGVDDMLRNVDGVSFSSTRRGVARRSSASTSSAKIQNSS
jgi:hypothetical protein